MRIDLNSDLGESFGAWRMGDDAALMGSITSANVACGYHAGDPSVMRETVALAKEHGVAIGAHPGYLDLVGFGRREMTASPREIEDMVVYQVAALAGIAAAQGVRLQHVKPHGALYNQACRSRPFAEAIARAIASVDISLILFGLPGSALLTAGEAVGLRVAAEGFADRAYERDGSLTPRQQPGSVIHDVDAVVARAVRMVKAGEVEVIDGSQIRQQIDTICVHGDTPGAARLASKIRAGLGAADLRVVSLSTTL